MSARRKFLFGVLVATTAVVGGCSPDDNPVSAAPDMSAAARRGRSIVVDPGTVTDLRVSSVADSSVVLAFTEVNDGAGAPADYEVRYAATPIGWGWGSATVVRYGTCASPFSGKKVGATLECSVAGLGPDTSYDFQIVAFRGTRNQSAVYGAISQAVTGVTARAGATDQPGDTAVTQPGDTTTTQPGDTVVTQITAPGTVADLAVKSVGATSAVLAFTQVSDGAGHPATYQVRYAASPMGWGWGGATVVDAGTCAGALKGDAIGRTLECTVEGLTTGKATDFRLVAYRGTLNVDAVYGELSTVATATPVAGSNDGGSTGGTNDGGSTGGTGGQPAAAECSNASPSWIFCDDFEQDRTSRYFEYAPANNSFVRAGGVGVGGSSAMKAHFQAGQVDAGSLKIAFGRTPQSRFKPVDAGTKDYREIYWRVYVRNEPKWTGGGGNKLTRATIFSSSTTWAQAMIAHVWTATSGPNWNYLSQDPASGTNTSGQVVTTTYNDFPNLRWLGATKGQTALFTGSAIGEWHCVETHARLNDAGQSNAVMEVWVDGKLDSQKTGFNWIGGYNAYGLNAVFLENYWNGGSPQSQERYLDNFVVSTQRIGCSATP